MVTRIEQESEKILKQAGNDYIDKVGDCSPTDIIAGLVALVSSYIDALSTFGNKKSDILDTFINTLKEAVEGEGEIE